MIKIIMYDDKWRIIIGDCIESETWEFETKKELISCLDSLLTFKDKYGRLKRRNEE